jgi:hypothetical protein
MFPTRMCSIRPATKVCKSSWTLSRPHAFSTTQQTGIKFSSVTMALLRNCGAWLNITPLDFRTYIMMHALRPNQGLQSRQPQQWPCILCTCGSVVILLAAEIVGAVLTFLLLDAESRLPPTRHWWGKCSPSATSLTLVPTLTSHLITLSALVLPFPHLLCHPSLRLSNSSLLPLDCSLPLVVSLPPCLLALCNHFPLFYPTLAHVRCRNGVRGRVCGGRGQLPVGVVCTGFVVSCRSFLNGWTAR